MSQYFNQFTKEILQILEFSTLELHPTLPKCVNVNVYSFYYEQYVDNPDKLMGRFIYENEGVWDTDGDDGLEFEIRITFSTNELLLKAKHYDSNSGYMKVKDGKPVIHRYKSTLALSEEEHFQLSTVQEVLPLEVYQKLNEFITKIHEAYNEIQSGL